MTHLICNAIENGSGNNSDLKFLDSFTPKLYSVTCLKESKQEEKNEENLELDLIDRNWNWKDPNFKYSPTRSKQQPGTLFFNYCSLYK